MALTSNQQAFLALVRAGLWEKEALLSPFILVDYSEVLRLAEEQSVVGLVAAGLEHVSGVAVPQVQRLLYIGKSMHLEERNVAMNQFVADLVEQMNNVGINPILLKGQGIAQCYERPLWRTSGDVDLLFDVSGYENAKAFVSSITQLETKEDSKMLEYCATVDHWSVELHGSLHCRLTKRLDNCLDRIQDSCCSRGGVRVWDNKGQNILLPSVDNDVFVVFTHIVKHFFIEGIGLRQICDWCRLLWKFRDSIDKPLLKKRLIEMKIMSEWKTFSALAVSYLGMPIETMPFYDSKKSWQKKSNRVLAMIIEKGSFGHSRDQSYYNKYPYFIVKTISLWRHTMDCVQQFYIFPWHSLTAWRRMIVIGINKVRNDKKRCS